jgi:hypothetical protein
MPAALADFRVLTTAAALEGALALRDLAGDRLSIAMLPFEAWKAAM